MYLTGLCRKNSIMDNALVPDQATDWSITLKPGSYTGDTKLQGNSAEFTFAKSSGIVTKDREKDWPIADRRDPSNNPRNNRGSNFFSNKIPFSFLKRRITQLKTGLFSWVKGEGLSYAFYPRFQKKFPRLSNNAENIQVCRGLFCPVQLINPKIIPPVGEGGKLLNNVLWFMVFYGFMVRHHPLT